MNELIGSFLLGFTAAWAMVWLLWQYFTGDMDETPDERERMEARLHELAEPVDVTQHVALTVTTGTADPLTLNLPPLSDGWISERFPLPMRRRDPMRSRGQR